MVTKAVANIEVVRHKKGQGLEDQTRIAELMRAHIKLLESLDYSKWSPLGSGKMPDNNARKVKFDCPAPIRDGLSKNMDTVAGGIAFGAKRIREEVGPAYEKFLAKSHRMFWHKLSEESKNIERVGKQLHLVEELKAAWKGDGEFDEEAARCRAKLQVEDEEKALAEDSKRDWESDFRHLDKFGVPLLKAYIADLGYTPLLVGNHLKRDLIDHILVSTSVEEFTDFVVKENLENTDAAQQFIEKVLNEQAEVDKQVRGTEEEEQQQQQQQDDEEKAETEEEYEHEQDDGDDSGGDDDGSDAAASADNNNIDDVDDDPGDGSRDDAEGEPEHRSNPAFLSLTMKRAAK